MPDSCQHCGNALTGKQRNFCCPGHKAKWHAARRDRQAEHLSITAAALELGVCRHTVRRAIQRGELHAIAVPTAGRPRLDVTRGELERYRRATNRGKVVYGKALIVLRKKNGPASP